MSGESRTEKPTPRRLEKARNEGQVARSIELNSAIVLITLGGALTFASPRALSRLETTLRVGLLRAARPGDFSGLGIWSLRAFALAVAPLAFTALLAGLGASVAQVRPKVTPSALKPRFQNLNPAKRLKRMFGKEGAIEMVKAVPCPD